MSQQPKPVVVSILDKEFRIACKPGEEAELLASARYLDDRMRDIRSSGKIVGSDRIAVIAALNVTHELLSKNQSEEAIDLVAEQRVRQLRTKIELALNQSNQLEF